MKWIDVDKKLPPEYTTVIVEDNGVVGLINGLHTGYEWVIWDIEEKKFMPTDVTHWMPLPDPPRG